MDQESFNVREPMTPEMYFQERLDKQIQWYDQSSIKNKKVYQSLKKWQMILSSLIPALVGFVTKDDLGGILNYVLAVIGVAVTVLTGLLSLSRYEENWLTYRGITQALQSERYLYLARAGDYTQAENPFLLLVRRVEAIMDDENRKWAQSIKEEKSANEPANPDGTGTRV